MYCFLFKLAQLTLLSLSSNVHVHDADRALAKKHDGSHNKAAKAVLCTEFSCQDLLLCRAIRKLGIVKRIKFAYPTLLCRHTD